MTPPNGTVLFQDPRLVGPQTVTAGATGYAYTAVIRSAQGTLRLPLYTALADTVIHGTPARISGTVDAIARVDNDGFFDLAVVLPALSLDNVLGSGQLGFVLPEDTATFPIVGTIPWLANLVMPTQTELFVLTFSEPDYDIDVLAQTTQTMYSVAVRLPTDLLLNPPDQGFLAAVEARELGVERGVAVGNGIELDIDSDIDLEGSVTVFVNGAPDGTNVTCSTLGSFIGPAGKELFMGYDIDSRLADELDSFEMAAPVPAGDIADVSNLLAGGYGDSSAFGEFLTGRVDRTPYVPPVTRTLDGFYAFPNVTQAGARFTWNNVAGPGQPAATWALAQIRVAPIDPADSTVVMLRLWNLVIPEGQRGFSLPSLPADAPGPDAGLLDVDATVADDRLVLDVNISNPAGGLEDVLIEPSDGITHYARRSITLDLRPADVIGAPSSAEGDAGIDLAPNPTAGEVTIRRAAPDSRPMRIEILDLEGRRVETLVIPGGSAQAVWDGRDASGRACAPGVYFIRPEGSAGAGRKIQRLR
jgi:hypothetical protein